jgi:hypothetical protein
MLCSGWFISICSLNVNISEHSVPKLWHLNLQMPLNHPEDSIQHSECGESLKSRVHFLTFHTKGVAICTTSFNNHDLAILLQRLHVYRFSEQRVIIFLPMLTDLLLLWGALSWQQIPKRNSCCTNSRGVLIYYFMANKTENKILYKLSHTTQSNISIKYFWLSLTFSPNWCGTIFSMKILLLFTKILHSL